MFFQAVSMRVVLVAAAVIFSNPALAWNEQSLQRLAPDAKPSAIHEAVAAMQCAQASGLGQRATRLALIDYSVPSRDKRLWVFDLANEKLLFEEYVAHGQGSGDDVPKYFSNQDGSHQSSLGLFLTEQTYQGGNGYSLRLEGLSQGLNDAAMARAIVMHGASYVNPAIAASMGRLGRSWGCPAVRAVIAKPMIDTLKLGQFIYAYGPGSALSTNCARTAMLKQAHFDKVRS